MNIVALIPAAGAGKRMDTNLNKLLFTLEDKPVIIHTLELFQRNSLITSIIIATSPNELETFKELIESYKLDKVKKIVKGGAERQDSVYNMLKAADSPDIVAIHDGARPLLQDEDLLHTLEIPQGFDGAVLGVPLKDTIKKVSDEHIILHTPQRKNYWLAQTPQVFRYETILMAHEKARKSHIRATDDSSVVEHYGGRVKIVPATAENIKITTREDIFIAEATIRKRRMGIDSGKGRTNGNTWISGGSTDRI